MVDKLDDWNGGTDQPTDYDPESELRSILERIATFQEHHADVVKENPTAAHYWQIGIQVVSAAQMLESAVNSLRSNRP